MSKETLKRSVENMIADDVSEEEIASVIQQYNSDKLIKKAKRESENLKSKYNFHDPINKPNVESEEPDLTSDMIESIEEKDTEDIPVANAVYAFT